MHPDLQRRFDALEERRRKLTDRVRALPEATQTHRPAGQTLSPAGMIMHMALAEEFNLARMQRWPRESLKRAKTTFVFQRAVQGMSNPKRPAPTVGAMIPKDNVSLAEADSAWAKARGQLKENFEAVKDPGAPFVKMVFVFGTPSASEFMNLLEAHQTYHEVRFPA